MYSSEIVPVSVFELSESSDSSSLLEEISLSSLHDSLEDSSSDDDSSEEPDSKSLTGSLGSRVGCRLCLVLKVPLKPLIFGRN